MAEVVQRLGPDVLEISPSKAVQCDGAIFRDFHEQQLEGSARMEVLQVLTVKRNGLQDLF